MLDKATAKNFSYLTIVQVLIILMPLIYYPYVVRTLGSVLYGEVILAQAIVGFLSILINFGFTISATRLASLNRDNTYKLSELFYGVFLCKISLFFLSLAIYAVLYFFLEDKFTDPSLLSVSLLICLSDVFLIQWFYQGVEKMQLVAVSTLISRVASLFLIFTFVNEASDVFIFTLILSASILLGNLLMFLYAIYKYKLVIPHINLATIVEIFKESALFFTSRFSVVLVEKLNITMLGFFAGTHYVSLYDLGNKCVTLLQLPFSMLNQAVYPRVAKSLDVTSIFVLIKYCLLLSILTYIIGCYMVEPIIELYAGKELLDSRFVFYILGLLLPINVISHFLGNCVLVVCGYSKQFNYSILYSAVLYNLSIFITAYFLDFDVYLSSVLIVLFNVLVMLSRIFYVTKLKLYPSGTKYE